MSGFQKNVTGQKWMAFAFNRTDSTPKTGDAGNITAKIRKDYGTATGTNDANPTEIEDGYYEFDLTQAETNADVLDLLPESSTADIQVIGISGRVFTVPPNFSDLGIETDGDLTKVNTLDGHTAQTGNSFARLGAPAGASVSADVAAAKVDTAAILVDTATLGAPAGASHAADIAAIKAETVLIVADTGELQTDWVDGGRLDLIIDAILVDTATLGAPAGASHAADIAAVKVDTAATLVDTATLGAPAGASHAADIAAIKVDTAATLVDTAEIGAAGAGLTALPWNSAWDTEVQSECNDAMVALGLDHLVSVAVVGADVADNSIVAKLGSKSSTADWDDFVNTTDSLQAIADASTPPTASAIADTVWDEAISGHVAGGSFGAQCGADIDAILTDTATLGAPAGASHAADIAAIKSETALIVADTNELQTDNVPGLIAALNDLSAAQVNTEVDNALDTATPGSPTAGSINETIKRLARSVGAVQEFTVDTGGFAATTTQCQVDAVDIDSLETTDDHYIGRVIVFTSGALKHQVTDITDYDGTNKRFSYTAITEVPGNNDTFIVV